jgi:hypothetical protein
MTTLLFLLITPACLIIFGLLCLCGCALWLAILLAVAVLAAFLWYQLRGQVWPIS